MDGTASVGFSHANESADAGAYSVKLGNGVTTELTATPRSGMARFTFPATDRANLLFKMASGRGSDLHFDRVSSTEISGYLTNGFFCASSPTYTVHFSMVFDRPMTSNGTFDGGTSVTFDTRSNRVVQAKVGLSHVSVAGAEGNRTAENPGWDFNATRAATRTSWNDLLGRVAITGGTADQQEIFYTALYHALLHPNLLSDSDGTYVGFDRKVHTVGGDQKARYGTFSGWDIYRTQAQPHALVAPQQASDAAQSLVNAYAEGGFLPKWSLDSAETQVMNGDPGPAVIADYHAFGARNFDTAAARNAMVQQGTTANPLRMGLDLQTRYGYLPSDGTYPRDFHGSVATLLSTAPRTSRPPRSPARWGTRARGTSSPTGRRTGATPSTRPPASCSRGSPTAPGGRGSTPRAATSSWRARPGSTRARCRTTSGGWPTMGCSAKLAAYLDSVLSDIRGAGGAHADLRDEPSIELPWEYDYIGQPWNTQAKVCQVQNELWSASAGDWGVGNDDLGTMSAWYVWSAMGFYPMTPGTADLALAARCSPM